MVMGPVSPLKFVLLRRTESQTKHQEHRSTVLWHTILLLFVGFARPFVSHNLENVAAVIGLLRKCVCEEVHCLF